MNDAIESTNKYVGYIVNTWTLLIFLGTYTAYFIYEKYYILIGTGIICLLILSTDFNIKRTRYKKRMEFVKNKIYEYEDKLDISHKGTSINSNDKIWKKRKTVFWPVLPSENPNLVHYAFVNTLKILLRNGFDIHILVYDMYYIKRMKSEKNYDNEKALKENIKKFIEFLKENGIKTTIKNGIVTYAKESDSADRRYYKNYSAVCSRLKLPDLKTILAKKDPDESTLLRLLKPISIVAFMATIEQRFFKRTVAITLSGYDEEILYNKCNDTIQNLYDGFVPFQMFIPIFSGFDSKTQPGVIDSRYRLTRDNLQNLTELAQKHKYDANRKNDPLNFIINMLIFSHAEVAMSCNNNQSDKQDINTIKQLCSQKCTKFAACIIKNAHTINMAN